MYASSAEPIVPIFPVHILCRRYVFFFSLNSNNVQPEKAGGPTKIAMPFVRLLHFIVVSFSLHFFPFRFTFLHWVFILLQLSVCFDIRHMQAACRNWWKKNMQNSIRRNEKKKHEFISYISRALETALFVTHTHTNTPRDKVQAYDARAHVSECMAKKKTE